MDTNECITWLEILRANMKTFPEVSANKKIEALTMAIKALEQESVLDKIRSEIEEIYADIDDVRIRNGLNLARRTITKYKAGSEGEE